MKNYLISAVIAVAVFIAGAAVYPPVKTIVDHNVGAVSSPDINSPYFSYGGLRKWAINAALKSATTTVCAFQSPVSTSTLTSAFASFSVSSTSASTVTIATSTTAFATTTVVARGAIGANNQGQLVSTTTVSVLNGNVVAPSTWFVVGMEGGTGTFSPTGVCGADFTQIAY